MGPLFTRALIVLALCAVVVAAGRWWQARTGKLHVGSGEHIDRVHLADTGLDVPKTSLGAILLGSPTCAPCVTVKELLATLEQNHPGFRWVYADAADHLELTAAHNVLRVPTLLVVSPDLQLVARISGVPHLADLHGLFDQHPSR